MATAAAVQVHPRTQSIRDRLGVLEVFLPGLEVLLLGGRQTCQRTTGAGIAAPHARILGLERAKRLSRYPCLSDEEGCRRERSEQHERQDRRTPDGYTRT